MGWFRRICTSPSYPMTLPRSTRNCLCRRTAHRGQQTANTHDERLCPRMAIREPTCTPSWSKRPRPLHPTTSRTAPRSPHRWCSRCHPPRLRNCAGPVAGWRTGCKPMPAPWCCRISPTPWPVGVGTGVIASSTDDLAEALREIADSETPYPAVVGQADRGPVWVFSGQGSQWAAMGADLLATEPVFAATVAQAEPLIAKESGFSVTEAMSAPETVTGIDRVQPTLFTMQVALAAVMESYGVRPGAVIGHSLGEAAAAVVAGALSLEDGVRVICRRSRLLSRISGSGAMASVELPGQQVLSEFLIHGVSDVVLSVVASPTSTVIGGSAQTIRELVATWQAKDVLAREVAVDIASHSPLVDPVLDELVEVLAGLKPAAPK